MTEITPLSPSSDDSVVFEFQTDQNGCCYYSKSKVGTHFYYEEFAYDPPTPIIATPVPVTEVWNVGRLEPGEYQVTEIHIRDAFTSEPRTTTESFTVTQGVLPFPEPAIPTIGIASAIVLAVGLAWIANRMYKKERRNSTA